MSLSKAAGKRAKDMDSLLEKKCSATGHRDRSPPSLVLREMHVQPPDALPWTRVSKPSVTTSLPSGGGT